MRAEIQTNDAEKLNELVENTKRQTSVVGYKNSTQMLQKTSYKCKRNSIKWLLRAELVTRGNKDGKSPPRME